MLGSTIGLTPTGELDLGGSASDNHTGVIVNTTAIKTDGVVDRLNTTTFSFAPAVGYFLAKGGMVGLNTNFLFVKTEFAKATYWGFTPVGLGRDPDLQALPFC